VSGSGAGTGGIGAVAAVVSPTVARGPAAAAVAAAVAVVAADPVAAAVEGNFLQGRELQGPRLNTAADFPGGLQPVNTNTTYVGHQVLTAVTISWHMMPCSLVKDNKRQ
jgi:hypothetical protein